MLDFFSKAISELLLQNHFVIVYTLIIIVAGLFAALISRHKDYQILLEKVTKLETKIEKLDDYIRLKTSGDFKVPGMYVKRDVREGENDGL